MADDASAFLGLSPPAPPSASAFLGASPPAPSATDFLGPAQTPWSLATIQQHAGPGVISSAARSAARNAAVGGSPTSSHLTDQALDFVPHDGDTARAAKALAASGVPYDQIIDEGNHVHVGWGPKMRGQFLPRKSFADSAKDFLTNATQAVRDLPSDIATRAQGGAQEVMAGARQAAPGDGQAADPLNALGGYAHMAGGALSWLLSPVTGATDALVGAPLAKATANAPSGHVGPVPYDLRLPKQVVGDAVNSAAGFLLGTPEAAEAEIPAATRYRPFKPTPEEAAGAIDGTAREVTPSAQDFLGEAPKPEAPPTTFWPPSRRKPSSSTPPRCPT
jgi:hypothetical protein